MATKSAPGSKFVPKPSENTVNALLNKSTSNQSSPIPVVPGYTGKGGSAISTESSKLPPVFIMLPGNFTGDVWHCAVAGLLGSRRATNAIKGYPIIVIGIQDPDPAVKPTDPSAYSLRGGQATFEYLRAINVPCLLGRMSNAQVAAYNNYLGDVMDSWSISYIQHMIWVYKTMSTGANLRSAEPFEATWRLTKTWDGPETNLAGPVTDEQKAQKLTRDNNILTNLKKTTYGPSNPAPELGFCVDPSILDAAFSETNKLWIWTSTTIAVQHLCVPPTGTSYPANKMPPLRPVVQGNVGECYSAIQEGLWASDRPLQVNDWFREATELYMKLKTITENVARYGWTETPPYGRKFILFNYRAGDVNRQHDANLHLLNNVRDIANRLYDGYYSVIPILVGQFTAQERANITAIYPDVLDLYPQNKAYDKRYTAAFWRMVATKLDDRILGLIGGRSGSVDIAAFMGLNCCSWDENVLDKGYRKNYDSDGAWLSQQMQYTRLYNQLPFMSITFLKESTLTRVPNDSNGNKVNTYTELDEAKTADWIKRHLGGDPIEIDPRIDESVQPRITVADRTAVPAWPTLWPTSIGNLSGIIQKDFRKLERIAEFGICAVNIPGFRK